MASNLVALSGNATWVEERAAQLNRNATELSDLYALTLSLLSSIDVLVNSTSSTGSCLKGPDGPPTGNCTAYWKDFYPSVLAGFNFTNSSSITPSQLLYIFSSATKAMLTAAPYTERQKDSDVGNTTAPLYGLGTMKLHKRGSVKGNYTRKFFFDSRSDYVGNGSNVTGGGGDDDDYESVPVPLSSPFRQILALGNGLCGSTCDTFSRTASLYSLNHPRAPSFRFVTFGGTGRAQDIGGTRSVC